ncbi:hypothetical protein BJX64DRAFT_290687 [Aspergillus heterothallicus]
MAIVMNAAGDRLSIDTCFLYGIITVTMYVFSIENLERPKAELDGLMGVAMHTMRASGG